VEPAPEIGGRNALAFDDVFHLPKDVRDRRNRRGKVTPEVGMAGHALLGVEINEQQGRLGDGAATGAERIGHRHFDADAADGTDGEAGRIWLAVHREILVASALIAKTAE
jgi:hypothetical protein